MSKLRWGRPSTEKLLARLGPIPHECGLEPAHGTIRVSEYADLVAGAEQRLYCGYVACMSKMVGQILRGIPSDERVIAYFETQRQYRYQADLMLGALQRLPYDIYRTAGGVPKLASWGFIRKGYTLRMDPADYLASAVRHLHEHRTSVKSKWAIPILGPEGIAGKAYGGTITREEARRTVLRAQAMNRAQGLTD